MTQLLNSLVAMPTYVTITFTIALVSMLSSLLKILMRSRAKSKIGKSLKVTCVSSIILVLAVLFYQDAQVNHAKDSVSIARDHNVVRISSNSQFLKSAKFQILAENKDHVFVEDDDSIYKVSKNALKGDAK